MKVIHNDYKYIDDVMNIINQAKAYFKRSGINQWQDGYPNHESIENDIANNTSYILIDEDKVIGTMFFNVGNDKTYDYIEDGDWLTHDQEYAVIHRIVVDENVKGRSLAFQLVEYAINECLKMNVHSIRIDTHRDNLSMQRFLNKHSFIQCGIIYLESGDQRIAFEKIVE